MRLSEATWTEVADLDTELAVLPVGSTEQHGPHAPLGTDVITGTQIAELGVEQYDGEAVIAPPLNVGIAEEHRHFPGTMWVTEDTFRDYLYESTMSLAKQGFNRVIFVNGHGGNIDALRELAGSISRREPAYAVPFTWFESVDVNMGHGGPAETALIRHFDPDLVREEQVSNAREQGSDHWGEWIHGVNLAYDSAEFTENGVVGDPSTTTAEDGKDIANRAADALADILEAVANRDLSMPNQKQSN
ncbi:creatininase family protein [Salinarchaeum sp. IM2453]|uniref:creatininase family protein n=1 Tax=Salinarchaeum sp. IM2453 TaxID=2862870 RepID=UPI001C82DC21|nr:creatininase family protein [Salinarchaeum sp. IM2453]QZA87837.1 creatininase family protein [Salinarchaeum sp. IM2453]